MIPCHGQFQDALLDALAVIRPSRGASLHAGVSALRAGSGQLIAVLGRMTAEQAREIAVSRRGTTPTMALVLGATAMAGGGGGGNGTGPEGDRDQAIATQILISAGWRAALVTADNSACDCLAGVARYFIPAQPTLTAQPTRTPNPP